MHYRSVCLLCVRSLLHDHCYGIKSMLPAIVRFSCWRFSVPMIPMDRYLNHHNVFFWLSISLNSKLFFPLKGLHQPLLPAKLDQFAFRRLQRVFRVLSQQRTLRINFAQHQASPQIRRMFRQEHHQTSLFRQACSQMRQQAWPKSRTNQPLTAMVHRSESRTLLQL